MNERFTYLVSKYLGKSLSETEKEEFAKLLYDPLCAEYLKKAEKAEKIIDEGIPKRIAEAEKKMPPDTDVGALQEQIEGSEFQEETEADISRFGSDISEETREAVSLMHRNMHAGRKRTSVLRYAGIAASIVFALVLFRIVQQNPTPQLIFEKYYKPYDFLIVRSSNNDNEIYAVAVDNYMEGNYEISSKLCRKALATQLPDPNLHFLYGLNLIQLDSLQSALQQFNTASTFPLEKNTELYLSLNWYESLCYLAMSQPDSALQRLNIIKDIEKEMTIGVDVEGAIKETKRLKDK